MKIDQKIIDLVIEASKDNGCTHEWKGVYTRNGTGVMCVAECGVLLCDGIVDKKKSELIAKEANSLRR